MSKVVLEGEAIEGKKIIGSSRIPLVAKGIEMYIGKNEDIPVYSFKAKFNTRGEISETLNIEDTKILEHSITTCDNELICDDSIIYSLSKNFTPKVTKGSHTHKTNVWNFPKQTAVEIIKPHSDIINSMNKK